MKTDEYARRVNQSLLRTDTGRRVWAQPRVTFEAMFARIERHRPAFNLVMYEQWLARDGKLDSQYVREARRCLHMLRYARVAHALGFIDDARYQRILDPKATVPHDEWFQMQILAGHYFPMPFGQSGSGVNVCAIYTGEGHKQTAKIYLEDGVWYYYEGTDI